MNELQTAILELEEKFKSQSCRICLSPDIRMKCHLINKKLIECLNYCTGITINQEDELPKQICKDCLSSLIIAYKFKKICLLTEKICKNLRQNKMKVELPDAMSSQAVDDEDYKYQFRRDHVDEDHVNRNLVNENQVKESYVHRDHAYDNHVNKDNYSINENHDETYLIYDPGVQDNDTNSIGQQSVGNYENGSIEDLQMELNSGVENQDSDQRSPKRKSNQNNTNVVNKQLIFGPFSKRKLQCMKLYCKWCKIKFDTKQEAGVHRQMVHKQSLTCKFCSKSFTRHSAHYLHVKSHLPPTLQCAHCDYRTALKQNMIVHVRTHSDGPKKYQCDKCPSSHHTASNLLDHRRKVHELVKRFACHICGKTFYDRTAFNKHVDTHSNIKPFECEICHTPFARRWNWKYHLLKKHGITLPPQKRGSRKLNLVVGETSVADQAAEPVHPRQTH